MRLRHRPTLLEINDGRVIIRSAGNPWAIGGTLTLSLTPGLTVIRLHVFLLLIAATALSLPEIAAAQDVGDTTRLAGLSTVDVRVEASWDDAITMDAGGATADQFRQALRMTFEETIESADAAPGLLEGAPTTVTCHVDTFYEPGQIIYSLRTQVEQPGEDGAPVITWIRSWVGSFNMQQMHVMFTLGTQCAERFLDDWASAN